MSRRRKRQEPPDEYWVDWSVQSGRCGWRLSPMHWLLQGTRRTVCGKRPSGGTYFRSVHGVKALNPRPMPGSRHCPKCFRRWQKHVAELLSIRKTQEADARIKRWERQGRPQIRSLKLF